MENGAVSGLAVVEWGSGVAVPFCGKIFADFGADVLKVESPAGDLTRQYGPFRGDEPNIEGSGLFFFLNTNKRSVTVDPTTADGRAALRRLLERADVFIENQATARLVEWGVDAETLARVNPRLVVISITPFGRTGPYAEWNGHDLNAYHLSGASNRYCGRPGEAPLQHGTFSAEFFGGYVGATWGLAAAYGAARGGDGTHLDVSCAEAIAAVFVGGQNIGCYAQEKKFEKRTGIGMPLGAPATILRCKDGYVWMMALEVGQWRGLRAAMGEPEWAQLEMFDDMFTRAQNADMLYPLIEEWTTAHTKQEVMDLCQANNCPTTALFTVGEVAEHPHLRERGQVVELEHPAMGRVRTLGAPVRLPAALGGPRRGAPLLGEHTAVVLGNGSVRWGTEAKRREGAATAGRLPLAGLRVANFGWGWLGPVAGQTLAWLGAEVYKIESRVRVDINRTLPPFGGGVRDPDRSLQNHAGWAGNGSVTIDLKKPAGQELARELVSRCDLVLENFGPGVMAKLHLGYDDLRAVNPEVVMVSMSAAGLFGPLRGVRTYGMSLSAISGLDSLTGYLGGPPVPVENAFADPLGGIIGAMAALLGLHHRARTGAGQYVDFSQQEGVMQLIGPAFMDYILNGRVAAPMGNRHPLGFAAPYGVFPCAGEDRWISIAVITDDEWQRLVQAMGSPAWARAPELAARAERVRRIDELHPRLAEWTGAYDDRELAARLQREGVAAAPVLNVADLLHDPHFRARGTFVEVTHPLGFAETIYGRYVKAKGWPTDVAPGPMMGCDNERVFKGLLGMPESRYQQLLGDKVIY